VDRWLEIIEADDADKAGLTSIRKKRRADQYKVGKVADKVAKCTDAVGEADKVAQVANSYAHFDLQEITMHAAKKRVYTTGYHSEKKRKLNQGFQLEAAKKFARVFASECLDRWLETINKAPEVRR